MTTEFNKLKVGQYEENYITGNKSLQDAKSNDSEDNKPQQEEKSIDAEDHVSYAGLSSAENTSKGNEPQETDDTSTNSDETSTSTENTKSEKTNSDAVFEFKTKDEVEINVKVNQLLTNDQLRLAGLLDATGKWEGVAEVVFKDMPLVLNKEIALIKLNGLRGGGSSGIKFLQLVTRAYKDGPTLTWGQFSKTCEKYMIYDIATAFPEEENPPEENLLRNFTSDERTSVGLVLDIDGRWEILARDEFGFDDTKITPLKNAVQIPGEFLQTRQLLGVIREKKPEYTLKELAKACHDKTIFNAVNLLREIGESRMPKS